MSLSEVMPMWLKILFGILVVIGVLGIGYLGGLNHRTTESSSSTNTIPITTAVPSTPTPSNTTGFTATDPMVSWKIFSSPAYGYTLMYPPNWSVQVSPVVSFLEDVLVCDPATDSCDIHVTISKSAQSNEGIANHIVSQNNVTFGGTGAVKFCYTNDDVRNFCSYGFNRDSVNYLVGREFVNPSSDYEKTTNLIIGTFKLKD